MTYPPEPWHLRGQMFLSVWRVPRLHLPAALPSVPPDARPVTLRGGLTVATAWVIYETGGMLSYNELLAAVLVRRGAHLRACITHIWVDSATSLRGGRALWGIPKELAEFELSTARSVVAEARTPAGEIAGSAFRIGSRLPGTWPLRFTVTQSVAGSSKDSRVRCRSRVEHATARWEPSADGPLAWLRGLRPILSVGIRDFHLRFGNPSG